MSGARTERRPPVPSPRQPTTTSPAVRHYLLTGEDDHSLEGKWQVYWLLYGPFDITREERARWDARAAFEPHRAALRAEGLTPIHIPELDDDEANDEHADD